MNDSDKKLVERARKARSKFKTNTIANYVLEDLLEGDYSDDAKEAARHDLSLIASITEQCQ